MRLLNLLLENGPLGTFQQQRFLLRISLGQDHFGRGEVLFDAGRRERQNRADPLESMPFRIFQKGPGVLRIVLHANEITDRVDILIPRQAVVGDTSPRRHSGRFPFLQSRGEPLHHLRTLLRPGVRFGFFRRHLSGADPLHDFEPLGRVLEPDLGRKIVDAEISLRGFRIVARQAMLVEVGLDLWSQPGLRGGCRRVRGGSGNETGGHGEAKAQ